MARPKAKRPLQEFSLIRTLHRRFGRGGPSIVRGIGDDAAIATIPAGRHLVLTTDLLAEGIHFDLRTASFEDVGYKAAMANLSDAAAMGARPEHILVALAVPASTTEANILRLYRGLMAACRPYRVSLIGGDTSASAHGLFISVTVTGTVPAGTALLRSGARVGDAIYVTGTLGDSRAGLALLSRRTRAGASRLAAAARRFLIGRHRRPIAHCRFGQLLSTNRLATAAIDISDGLSGDLRHICEESRTGALLDLRLLPISAACRAYAKAERCDAMQLALAGGEDYELLFTVAPQHQARIERLARNRGSRITRIGTIRPRSEGLRATYPNGSVRPLPVTSYEHFH